MQPLVIAQPVFNIKNFGAVADGSTINTKAFQTAIDSCNKSGGGSVVVGGGVYVTGSLQMKSNVNLSPYQGWVGEEDEGQLSATYVLLAMGLFEVDGGCAIKPFYNVSTPVFDAITIKLDTKYYPGKSFTIICKNNKPNNKYIQSASLNGVAVNRAWLYHEEIVKGGKLELTLGPLPNKAWGTILSPVNNPLKN